MKPNEEWTYQNFQILRNKIKIGHKIQTKPNEEWADQNFQILGNKIKTGQT